ncbi:MAG: hypothetical protein MJ252_11265, partial [archaeon]|nr:hypothetical protein [archaeon]
NDNESRISYISITKEEMIENDKARIRRKFGLPYLSNRNQTFSLNYTNRMNKLSLNSLSEQNNIPKSMMEKNESLSQNIIKLGHLSRLNSLLESKESNEKKEIKPNVDSNTKEEFMMELIKKKIINPNSNETISNNIKDVTENTTPSTKKDFSLLLNTKKKQGSSSKIKINKSEVKHKKFVVKYKDKHSTTFSEDNHTENNLDNILGSIPNETKGNTLNEKNMGDLLNDSRVYKVTYLNNNMRPSNKYFDSDSNNDLSIETNQIKEHKKYLTINDISQSISSKKEEDPLINIKRKEESENKRNKEKSEEIKKEDTIISNDSYYNIITSNREDNEPIGNNEHLGNKGNSDHSSDTMEDKSLTSLNSNEQFRSNKFLSPYQDNKEDQQGKRLNTIMSRILKEKNIADFTTQREYIDSDNALSKKTLFPQNNDNQYKFITDVKTTISKLEKISLKKILQIKSDSIFNIFSFVFDNYDNIINAHPLLSKKFKYACQKKYFYIVENFKSKYGDYLRIDDFKFELINNEKNKNISHNDGNFNLRMKCQILPVYKQKKFKIKEDSTYEISYNFLNLKDKNKENYINIENNEDEDNDKKYTQIFKFDIRNNYTFPIWFSTDMEKERKGKTKILYTSPIQTYIWNDFIEIKIMLMSKSLQVYSVDFNNLKLELPPRKFYEKLLHKNDEDYKFDLVRSCEIEQMVHYWMNENEYIRHNNTVMMIKKIFEKNFKVLDIKYDINKYLFYRIKLKAERLGVFSCKSPIACQFEILPPSKEIINECVDVACVYIVNYENNGKYFQIRKGSQIVIYCVEEVNKK